MKRPTRPSADKTREKILKAAKRVFLKKGFDAAYMADIARYAKVNTNLIFHHFENKEALFHTVKESIFADQGKLPEYDLNSAKAYFKSVLDYRFKRYGDHPDLAKLIQWQHLTENSRALLGNDLELIQQWIEPIKKFQKEGKIKDDINIEHLILFVIYSSHAPFMQRVIRMSEEEIQGYKNMIFSMCCHQFLTKKGMNEK